MTNIHVSNSVELLDAIKVATNDTTLVLSAGDYGRLDLNGNVNSFLGSSAQLTIKSADANNPAKLTALHMDNCANIVMDEILFDYLAPPGTSIALRPFSILNCENIKIENSFFDGDIAEGVASTDNGMGSGTAMSVGSSNDVEFSNNTIVNFWKGAVFTNTNNLTVKGNDLSELASDGLDFANVKNALIEENYLHDFASNPDTTAHKDMIQFWTKSVSEASQDVIIRGNILDSGMGTYTQSMLIKSEQGLVTEYKNFLIENNFIHNAFTHGITINQMDGLTIRNNTIISNPDSAVDDTGRYVPKIHIGHETKNIVVQDNITNKITGTGWTGGNNLIVQNTSPDQPNYYGDIFVNGMVGGRGTIDDFRAVTGGIIEQMGVGSKYTASSSDYQPLEPSSNLSPVTSSDHAFTHEGESVAIDVLSNDTDPDADLLTIDSIGLATNGIVSINFDKSIQYTPNFGFYGRDMFTYVASDGLGGLSSETVSVDVSQNVIVENSNPDAQDDNVVLDANSAIVVDVRANDVDIDNDSLSIVSITQPENGTVEILGYNKLKYAPNDDYFGNDNFSYVISDGMGGTDIGSVFVVIEQDMKPSEFPIDNVEIWQSSYPEVELEQLSGFDDSINLSGDDDFVSGMAGNDHLRGLGGDDIISAGDGNDTLRAGSGDDWLEGGSGNDRLFGGNGKDVLFGGAGSDVLRGNYRDQSADIFGFTTEDIGSVDIVKDFRLREGDQLDVTRLFQGTQFSEENVEEYLTIVQNSHGSMLRYDLSGSGDRYSDLARLYGVDDLSVLDLLDNDALIF